MKRMNFPDRKARRRVEAGIRADTFTLLPEEQKAKRRRPRDKPKRGV